MTGFRVAYGGAQALYGVRPDLSLFGKVIGGGLPVGAYGGRRDLMEQIAPSGPVYQAGTLSGSPPAMAAGGAALDVLREDPGLYQRLERLGERLQTGFETAAGAAGVACTVGRVGSMVTPFLGIDEARSFDDVREPIASASDGSTPRGWTPGSSGRRRNSRPRFFRPHTRMRTWTGPSSCSLAPCLRSQSDLRGDKKMVLDWRLTWVS